MYVKVLCVASKSIEERQKSFLSIFNIIALLSSSSRQVSSITHHQPHNLDEQISPHPQVLGIHPILTHLMIGNVIWWDPKDMTPDKNILGGLEEEGHLYVKGIGAEIAFNFLEEEMEDETGETTVAKFEKLERFIQFVPILWQLGVKVPIMDYTIVFGVQNLGDGKSECYQKCVMFWGPWIARAIVAAQ